MAPVIDFRKTRFQFLLICLGLLGFWFVQTRNRTPFTNEEINSLLSGEDQASDIDRDVIENQQLHAPYLNKDLESDNWVVVGDTMVRNKDFVRLTTDAIDQHGLIYNKNSFNSDGFEIEFKFRIHGEAKPNQLKGDGFAMFLTADKQDGLGPVFGALDFFKGLGIFFDTYRNDYKGPIFPYISVTNSEFFKYDKDHDGKANEIAGCSAKRIYNPTQGFTNVRIIHTVEDGYLSLDYNVDGEWQNCFSIKDVSLPKERYLSFSAATGQLVEKADLYDVDVWELKQFGEVITSWRDFAEHIDEDENEQEEDQDSYVDYQGNKRKLKRYGKKRSSKQRAKLRSKLRNRDLRNEAFNVKDKEKNEGVSFFRTLWNLFKFFVFLLSFLIVFYVGFTIYRVKKKTWKSQRKTTGLLD